jgi:hypothetical protein
MQQQFVDALAPVLRDARSAGVPEIEIEDSDRTPAPGYLAAMRDDTAVWICPVDRTPIVEIGAVPAG